MCWHRKQWKYLWILPWLFKISFLFKPTLHQPKLQTSCIGKKKPLCFFISQTPYEYTWIFFRIHILAEMGAKFPSAKENQFQKTFILPCVILAMHPNHLLNNTNIQMQIESLALPPFMKRMPFSLYEMEFSVCHSWIIIVEHILAFKYLHTQLYRSFRDLYCFNGYVHLLTTLSAGSRAGKKIQVKNTAEEKQ